MSQRIPEEVVKELKGLNDTVKRLEHAVEFLMKNRPQYDSLNLLDKARMELATLFTVNSLYWVMLRCKGEDPSQDANLATELKRIKEYIEQLKKFDEADKRPKYANKTVERFVKHSLFDINSDSGISSGSTPISSIEDSETDEPTSVSVEESGDVVVEEEEDIIVEEDSEGEDEDIIVVPTKRKKCE